jgi:DNA-binding CsgD family transcriptional regulator/tetratricopeptide (TPR) repeat protein
MATYPRRPGPVAQLTGRSSELSVLDGLIDAVRAGQSRVLVVSGEPGAGKTALLDYLAGRADGCRVERASGVESEMELAFAGLHQLCAPVLDRLDRLPGPQRDALRTAFGQSAGPAPDRFLVGLAVLGLLSEVAEQRPLVCVVDDEQWLDRASAQALGFVARRLAADPVGLVFAARVPSEDLRGLPQLTVEGLRAHDARALLDSVLAGPLDARVRDRFVAETRGNPLALLELPRGVTPAELAGGFGLPGAKPGATPLAGRIEETFRRRVQALAPDSRRLLQLAAADPSGDSPLVWRAAGKLGIPLQAATPVVEAGLAEFGAQVRFRHPLVRSAAYLSASLPDRLEVHGALAEVTDPQADPDRRAWHRAQAAPGPDEDIAEELERSAGRAQARGGLAAAAAFLARAALLTPDPGRRAGRLLAAAQAKRDAGAPDAALSLLAETEAEPVDELQAAQAERLRGQIAFDQRRGPDAARLLLSAARRLESVDAALAREAHLESLMAAYWVGPQDAPGPLSEAAQAARAAVPGPDPPRPVDALLDAFAIWFTGQRDGSSGSHLTQARDLLLTLNVSHNEADRWAWLTAGTAINLIGLELCDPESWYALTTAQVRFARETGALVHLQFALNYLASAQTAMGELASAARLMEEDHLIAEATGNPPVALAEMMIATWRGREDEAVALIEAVSEASAASGLGLMVDFCVYARSVLYNGLGRYDAARDAARRAFELHPIGYGPLVLSELAEAAARTGDAGLAQAALESASERAQVTPTAWALGLEARARALLSSGEAADNSYRESIGHLGQTRMRSEVARAHLLYGEWLRRENRRFEAREQLRTARDMLDAMGMEAFAERARRELLATGESARKPVPGTSSTLTAQEGSIARLAGDGRTNSEIGAQLFLSPRTVEWHLRKIFTKLGVTSRRELRAALAQFGHDGKQARPRT